jgi:formiminotetrahydrofolate cyclodeaminase
MSSVNSWPLNAVQPSIWALTATQVRDQAASTNPTPGGGSISVITATLGLALVHKGASISLKKSTDDPNRQENLVGLCARVSSSMASLSRLADADARAYQSYIKARSLPRATENEKSVRRASMEAGLLRATQIPLESAAEMCRALELSEAAVRLSDEHLLSDIFAGALLICTSVQGVLLNVDANLSGISDKGIQEAAKCERVELEGASIARGEAIAQAYQTRLSASTDR